MQRGKVGAAGPYVRQESCTRKGARREEKPAPLCHARNWLRVGLGSVGTCSGLANQSLRVVENWGSSLGLGWLVGLLGLQKVRNGPKLGPQIGSLGMGLEPKK